MRYKNYAVSIYEIQNIINNLNFVQFVINKSKKSIIIEGLNPKNVKLYSHIIGNFNDIYPDDNKKIYFRFIGDSMAITNKKSKETLLKNKMKKITEKYKKIKPRDAFIKIVRIKGEFIDIQKCWIEQYIQDIKKRRLPKGLIAKCTNEGEGPYERYKKQLNKLWFKKDYFEVTHGKDYYSYPLFIPCHPRCKNALKILKKFERGIK